MLFGCKTREDRRVGQTTVVNMLRSQSAECSRCLLDSARIVIRNRRAKRFARGFQIGVNLSRRTRGTRDN